MEKIANVDGVDVLFIGEATRALIVYEGADVSVCRPIRSRETNGSCPRWPRARRSDSADSQGRSFSQQKGCHILYVLHLLRFYSFRVSPLVPPDEI